MTVNPGVVALDPDTKQTPFLLAYVTWEKGNAVSFDIGDVPACVINSIEISKSADFNAGTLNTLDVGINYSDSTTDDPDALVDGHDLSSSTALGTLAATLTDSAAHVIAAKATITGVLALTGTAATAGAAYVKVNFTPTRHAKVV